ncbi:cytochrome D1 domain-containing protein [Allosphingosinicella deserti]|nr:cytochrome D1 domain-containing protein [Sphingomonas deserti]
MKLLALAALLVTTAMPAAAETLLVGNKGEDSLSFVDLATGKELGRAATGRMPHEIALSPDGRQAAVVAYGAASIDIFDVAARTRVRTIDLAPNAGPHGLVWLADGRLIATTERSRSLTIVDTRNGDAVRTIPTAQEATHMVAVSADGQRAYTANMRSGSVSVIDLKAGRKLRDIPVGGEPEAIALSRDGKILWVGDNKGARVQAFSTSAAVHDPLATVATGGRPIRVAVSPDGKWVVTSDLEAGSLTLIDARTRKKVRSVPVSGTADAQQVTILFSADGTRLYVAETGRDQVAEIAFPSGKVLRRLAAGKAGDGLGIAP